RQCRVVHGCRPSARWSARWLGMQPGDLRSHLVASRGPLRLALARGGGAPGTCQGALAAAQGEVELELGLGARLPAAKLGQVVVAPSSPPTSAGTTAWGWRPSSSTRHEAKTSARRCPWPP